jgi:hypothetical protein
VQHFLAAAAVLADAVRVAVEDLEHRQRLLAARHRHRHPVRRRERHHRVEADVVLAAERARVRERARGDEVAQARAGLQLGDERAHELVGGRVGHEPDERLERTERQRFGLLHRVRRRHRQLRRHGEPEARRDHSASDLDQETPPIVVVHRCAPRAGHGPQPGRVWQSRQVYPGPPARVGQYSPMRLLRTKFVIRWKADRSDTLAAAFVAFFQ